MSQSAPGALPESAWIVTLPSPVWTRTLLSLPSRRIEPSPVLASTSPPSMRPRMLPSPDRSWTCPATRSMSIDPSPLFAETSEDVGHRNDQLRRSVVEVEVEAAVIALRLGHRDLDPVAVLLRLHLDRRDIVLVSPALLDDDLDVRLVPGPNLDRAVEGGQRDVGLP